MNKTIGRYMRNAKELGNGKPAIQDDVKVSTPFALSVPVLIFAIIAILMEAFHDKLLSVSKDLKEAAVSMSKKIEFLEVSKRKLMGDCVESCSIEELYQIEEQLQTSLSNIRARKNQVFKEKIQQLKEEVENQSPRCQSITLQLGQREIPEVDTGLFIGPPGEIAVN
ncbi:hypothetical protein RHMOL_Rhmol07G0115100 [Rhododendron molle]|uniref:Uncharacterized protein n=1 Tax=Rhododendron molle TaxID=49168 RepID=A0ACC0N0K7_RHOML|nr:hypothetical protein RHMOL_Rhmol07G0115100 [Rhododendron molle]